MCGICGFISTSKEFKPHLVEVMKKKLLHRGPDAEGSFIDIKNKVALGHQRLKIIDLSNNANQPMIYGKDEIVLVFNGEIYNYKEEKRILQNKGYKFKTQSDTEVVLLAYKEYGENFIEKLNGDFAIAIWDKKEKSLKLFRDRAGVKPLYYHFKNGVFSFASEIKALLILPWVKKEVNFSRLSDYMSYLTIYGEETMFKDIFEVQPGQKIIFKNNKINKSYFWRLEFKEEYYNYSLKQAEKKLLELLDSSIKKRLIGDVPIGVYLSGGIDSSLVATRLSNISRAQNYTYSTGFDHKNYNEFFYSDIVAKKIKSKHTKFNISLDDKEFILDTLRKCIYHFDEPLPFIPAIGLYLLAQKAKRYTTIALSGSGGDELFAGYPHYRIAYDVYKKSKLGRYPKNISEKEKWQLKLSPELLAAEFKTCTQTFQVKKIFKNYKKRSNLLKKLFQRNKYPDFISKMLYMDSLTHLPKMMVKDDKMNMAFSIEGRFPFLDYRLMEFAYSLPPSLKIKGNVDKFLLKNICIKYYNKSFINRPKQGFPIPVDIWINKGILNFEYLRETPFWAYLNKKYVEELLLEHKNHIGNHTRRLFGLWTLSEWYKIFF